MNIKSTFTLKFTLYLKIILLVVAAGVSYRKQANQQTKKNVSIYTSGPPNFTYILINILAASAFDFDFIHHKQCQPLSSSKEIIRIVFGFYTMSKV